MTCPRNPQLMQKMRLRMGGMCLRPPQLNCQSGTMQMRRMQAANEAKGVIEGGVANVLLPCQAHVAPMVWYMLMARPAHHSPLQQINPKPGVAKHQHLLMRQMPAYPGTCKTKGGLQLQTALRRLCLLSCTCGACQPGTQSSSPSCLSLPTGTVPGHIHYFLFDCLHAKCRPGSGITILLVCFLHKHTPQVPTRVAHNCRHL